MLTGVRVGVLMHHMEMLTGPMLGFLTANLVKLEDLARKRTSSN